MWDKSNVFKASFFASEKKEAIIPVLPNSRECYEALLKQWIIRLCADMTGCSHLTREEKPILPGLMLQIKAQPPM